MLFEIFTVPTDDGQNGKDRDFVTLRRTHISTGFRSDDSYMVCFLGRAETRDASLHTIRKSHIIHYESYVSYPSLQDTVVL